MHRITLCLSLLMVTSILMSQNCSINQDIRIGQGTSNLTLNVSGLVNNDLAVNQQVCGVRLVFEHSSLENLRITLVSPSGQSISLIGPGRTSSALTPFIDWNISFNSCGEANDPDSGIPEVWDNASPWASFSLYTGTYDPFAGCLEDFNMGPANGSWTLMVENLGEIEGLILYFEIIFCEPEGLNCENCVADPGIYDFGSPGGIVNICEGQISDEELFKVTIEPDLGQDQTYLYVYKQNDQILSYDVQPNQTELLPSGTYEICGLTIESMSRTEIEQFQSYIDLETALRNHLYCGALTEECLTVRILPVAETIVIDTVFCDGDTVFFRDLAVTEDLDTTIYIPGTSFVECDSAIMFRAEVQILNAEIVAPLTEVNCGNSLFLNGTQSMSTVSPIVSYLWETDDGTLVNNIGPVAEVIEGGNYELIVSDGICTDTAFIQIDETSNFEPQLEIEAPQCLGDSAVLHVSAPLGTVFTLPSAEFTAIDNMNYYTFSEGNFSLQADFGSCSEVLNFNIDLDLEPVTIEFVLDSITCEKDFATIEILTNASDPLFALSGPAEFETDQSEFDLMDSGQYNLSINYGNDCSIDTFFTILENITAPGVTVEDLTIDCDEMLQAFELDVDVVYESIAWSGPDGFQSEEEDIVPDQPGSYEYLVTGTNGCTQTGVVQYTINNIAVDFTIEGDSITCANPEVELCILSGAMLDSILWNGQAGEGSCIQVDSGAQITFEIYSGRCSTSGEYSIIDLREELDFSIILSDQDLGCTVSEITAMVESESDLQDYSISWILNGQLMASGEEFVIDSPGSYTLQLLNTITDCTYSEVFEIEDRGNTLMDFNAEVTQPNCYPEPGILEMSGFPINTVFGIFLNDEAVDFRDLPILELSPGTYTLEVEDENGCYFETVIDIIEGNRIELELGDDINAAPLIGTPLSAESNLLENQILEFNWTVSDSLSCTACLNPVYFPVQSQMISLEIIDEKGCSATDSLFINITEDQIYFIPNIFSPNGDNDNDNFEIYISDAIIAVFDFRIFDRWGNLLLFRPEISGDYSNFVWDGRYNGREVEIGVYTYMAKLLLVDGTERQIYGHFSLLR